MRLQKGILYIYIYIREFEETNHRIDKQKTNTHTQLFYYSDLFASVIYGFLMNPNELIGNNRTLFSNLNKHIYACELCTKYLLLTLKTRGGGGAVRISPLLVAFYSKYLEATHTRTILTLHTFLLRMPL